MTIPRPEFKKCVGRVTNTFKVDYIPLYYIHRRDYKYDIENVTGTLTKFIEEGKIGGLVFRNFSKFLKTRF